MLEHKGALDTTKMDDDSFDIAVEDAIADRPSKRAHVGKSSGGSLPRHVRDKKFGFGGRGRRDKQNTRSSTDDFVTSARSGPQRVSQRGKGHQRPGKSRRAAGRTRS
jgi:rRNA-processing protein EBP2